MANINNIQLPDGNTYELVKRSVTQAEYDALSDAEKNNGTVYFITDAVKQDDYPVMTINLTPNPTFISNSKLVARKCGHLVTVYGEFTTSSTASTSYADRLFTGLPSVIGEYNFWFFGNCGTGFSNNTVFNLAKLSDSDASYSIFQGQLTTANTRYLINPFSYFTND